jgi:hypothetical protein
VLLLVLLLLLLLCRYGPARQELMNMDTARQLLKSSLQVRQQGSQTIIGCRLTNHFKH